MEGLFSPLFSPVSQSFLDLSLKSLVRRLIVDFSLEILRKVFLFNEEARIIMGVFIIFSVTKIPYQSGWGIPNVKRNRHILDFIDISLDLLKGGIKSI